MSNNTRVDFTFVIPNTRWHREGEGRYWNHIPYPEGLLTAVLRKNGYTVNHVDANTNNLTENELHDILREKVLRPRLLMGKSHPKKRNKNLAGQKKYLARTKAFSAHSLNFLLS